MVEGIWGNFKNQIEKFKIPTAPLLYRYGVWGVFVAATFTVALFLIIRRLKTCDYIIGMKYKVCGIQYALFL